MKRLFKEACYAVFVGLADADLYLEAYSAIKTLVWVVTVVVVRLVMLVLFPVSIPLVLWLLVKKQKKRMADGNNLTKRQREQREKLLKPRFECKDVDGIRYEIDNGEQE